MSSSFKNYLTEMTIKRYEKVRARLLFQNTQIACNNWQTCINCDSYEKETGNCKYWKAVVPARVAVIGCEEYVSDIPF